MQEFLVFKPGQTRTNESIYAGSEFEKDPTLFYVPWNPGPEQRQAENWFLMFDNVLVYDPPVYLPVQEVVPDVPGFFLDVTLDPLFSDREVLQVQAVKDIPDLTLKNQTMVALISAAPVEKQVRLLELAQKHNITLPQF